MTITKLSKSDTLNTIVNKGKQPYFYDEIMSLESGESISIKKDDWDKLSPKTSPSVYYYYYRHRVMVTTKQVKDHYLIIKY